MHETVSHLFLNCPLITAALVPTILSGLPSSPPPTVTIGSVYFPSVRKIISPAPARERASDRDKFPSGLTVYVSALVVIGAVNVSDRKMIVNSNPSAIIRRPEESDLAEADDIFIFFPKRDRDDCEEKGSQRGKRRGCAV